MASLVPCTACQRHIRRAEIECPFCGAQQTPVAGPFVEVTIPLGIKRAALFAIGLTLAGQACGGKSEGDNDPGPSGAGASVGASNGGTGGNAAGGGTSGSNAFGGTGNTPTDFGPPVPPYGLIPPPPGGTGGTAGSAGSTGMPEPGPSEDAGVNDAGGDAAPDDDAGP